MTTKVEKTIQVDVPLSTVYNQWTQFEDFPRFMGGVESVTQLDDQTLHWVAQIMGVKREWDATILEQIPDQKIAWAATEGATNAGAVYFEPAGSGQTTVRLTLEFEPEGVVEKVGDMLHVVDRRAAADLERFKSFIESEDYETGAWRGTINPGADVGTPGVEAAASSRGDSGTDTGAATGMAGMGTGMAVGTGTATGAGETWGSDRGTGTGPGDDAARDSSARDSGGDRDSGIEQRDEQATGGDVIDVNPVDVNQSTSTSSTGTKRDDTLR